MIKTIFNLIKWIRGKLRIVFNKVYFLFFKVFLHKNVSLGKITFFKGFVLDILAKDFFMDIGNVVFKENCTIRIRKNGKLKIEDGVFFNRGCSLNCLNYIEIGENSLFGENIKLYDHNHQFKNKDIFIKDQDFSLGKIKIGKNCWIGSNVTILKDVCIGDNVVIGANCLIYQNIDSNSLVKSNSSISVKKLK